MRLMEKSDLLYKGYHLGLDNYFSSPKLFLDLYDKATLATGTVRKNRKGLPKTCLSTKLQNQGVCERRKGPLLCTSYKDGSKNLILLSTACNSGYTDVVTKKNKIVKKPKIVATYNKVMGGVDLKDAKLYSYLSERKTMKWTKKAFLSLMGTALLNSYIVYSKNTSGNVMNRYNYMISVSEALVGNYNPKKKVKIRRTSLEIEASRASPSPIQPPHHNVEQEEIGHKLTKLERNTVKRCAAPMTKGSGPATSAVRAKSLCAQHVFRIFIKIMHNLVLFLSFFTSVCMYLYNYLL